HGRIHALPARTPGRRSQRRSHRRPAKRGLGRSRKPHARAKSADGIPAAGTLVSPRPALPASINKEPLFDKRLFVFLHRPRGAALWLAGGGRIKAYFWVSSFSCGSASPLPVSRPA